MTRLGTMVALFVVLLAPSSLLAQDTVVVARPGYSVRTPRELAREAVRLFNEADSRLFGSTDIRPGDAYRGNVGILGGSLRLDGEIEGTLVAINADVELAPGARIGGDVIIVGGTLSQDPDARIIGDVHVNGRHVDVRRDGERIELEGSNDRPRRSPSGHYRYVDNGRSSIVLGVDGYNRVEGAPVRGGARFRWFGPLNGELEAVGIAKTAQPFDSMFDRLGYDVRGHLGFGWNSVLEIGGAAYDRVVPIEDWTLSDEETALASVLLRRDYRDYYGLRGVSAYVRLNLSSAFRITGERSWDDETSVAARDPWTLTRRGEAWRINPGIDEGRFTHYRARFEYDSRNYNRWSDMPRWLLSGEYERGDSRNVTLQPLPEDLRGLTRGNGSTVLKYDRWWFDLRRYQPIGNGELRVRAVFGGDLAEAGSVDHLPVQRRMSLGGPDPLPGFAFHEVNCTTTAPGVTAAGLCTGVMLLQAEYRGGLSFGLFDFDEDWFDSRATRGRRDRRDHEGVEFDSPQLVLFGDVGAVDHANTTNAGAMRADLGLGIEFGSVGIYAARATTSSAPIRFSLRLHHRF